MNTDQNAHTELPLLLAGWKLQLNNSDVTAAKRKCGLFWERVYVSLQTEGLGG
jgi:hypothetical protein